MKSKLSVCIIDDEQDIRDVLKEAINETQELEVVGEAGSYSDGLELISNKIPDAVFLDIKLMEGDAFQILNSLKRREIKMPAIILNTGYTDFEYAQKSLNEFRDCVIKILQKPFWENWNETKHEIIDAIILHHSNARLIDKQKKERIQFRSDNESWFIKLDDIYCFKISEQLKGSGKVEVMGKESKFVINKTLTQVMVDLPSQFFRVSRYAAVNTNYISKIDHSDHVLHLKNNDLTIGVGQNYLKPLIEFLS